jgi:hypothetical protein
MSDASRGQHSVRQGIAAGTSIAAAILLFVVGVLSVLEGISGIAADRLLVVGADYVYKLDTRSWGWIHVVVGVVLVVAAVGLLMGTTWGRVAAMVVAAVSIVENFLWLPYYPAWSILIIALDVVVIWAVATWTPHAAS